MEYKQFRAEVKAKTKNTFEGYASVFGNKDDGGDIMQYGAFTKTILENMRRIKVLYMHSMFDLIGKPLRLNEDSKGLEFEAFVSDTILGKDVMTLINDKVITDMSIGYERVKSDYDEVTNTRTLKEVKLWEISPVTWGMNELAGIKGRFDFLSNYGMIKKEVDRLEALIKGAGLTTPRNEPFKNDEIDPEVIQSILDKY